MVDKDIIVRSIEAPMDRYHENIVRLVGNWESIVAVSEDLLAGKEVDDEAFPPALGPIVDLMRVVMQYTKDATWDWSNPAVQEVFSNLTDSHFYKAYAEAAADMVLAIAGAVGIGTLVEVGTGPGQVSGALCKGMSDANMNIPFFISDRAPTISNVGRNLKNAYPGLHIEEFIWDIKSDAPEALVSKLKKPVLLFERFSIPYGGYESIDPIGRIADILVMVEDLNLTGKKEPYDTIMEKIGAQFLEFKEVETRLDKHFPFVHTCDQKTIDAIHLPVTDFTLAVK